MPVIDAQIHLWKGSKPNPNHRQIPDYTADDALSEMAGAGVDAAVIHPPGWDPNANALAVEAARAHPARFAVLGNFPLDRPESRNLIEGWKSRPGMLGLRFALLQPHQQTWLSDGTMDWLWPAAERAGLPIALLGPNLLQVIGAIAERHRGLKLIIDHFGRPDVRRGIAQLGFETMLEFGRTGRAVVKLSGPLTWRRTGAVSRSGVRMMACSIMTWK